MARAEETGRRRGRPKGASWLNEADNHSLARIADLIIKEPMRPTTAIRRIGVHGEAETRRLQRKWRDQEQALLSAAQTRRETSEVSLVTQLAKVGSVFMGAVAAVRKQTKRLHTWTNSREGRRVAESVKAFSRSSLGQALIHDGELQEARRAQAKTLKSGSHAAMAKPQKAVLRLPRKP